MDETGISLQSDRESLYLQVEGFEYHQVENSGATCASVGLPTGCKSFFDSKTNASYLFYYPDDESTQYLYESYPDQISPIEGVTNEHFIVWMKVALLPTFRKLYGRIDQSFRAGDRLVFTITANYEVDSFSGTKSIVLTNLGSYGGKNTFIGEAYIAVGAFSLIVGSFYLFVELIRRYLTRKLW